MAAGLWMTVGLFFLVFQGIWGGGVVRAETDEVALLETETQSLQSAGEWTLTRPEVTYYGQCDEQWSGKKIGESLSMCTGGSLVAVWAMAAQARPSNPGGRSILLCPNTKCTDCWPVNPGTMADFFNANGGFMGDQYRLNMPEEWSRGAGDGGLKLITLREDGMHKMMRIGELLNEGAIVFAMSTKRIDAHGAIVDETATYMNRLPEHYVLILDVRPAATANGQGQYIVHDPGQSIARGKAIPESAIAHFTAYRFTAPDTGSTCFVSKAPVSITNFLPGQGYKPVGREDVLEQSSLEYKPPKEPSEFNERAAFNPNGAAGILTQDGVLG
eukprot:TRINITY_DN29145_c0_g1_i1.p1 TRINITY_DN29145_c0_g1~~TRINITY_DN29145_c0_g1_i1.p1  ORF type:complete len:336 (-),score=44.95 TRINITY_DN29145_c0_g1_i1:17-1003(-)